MEANTNHSREQNYDTEALAVYMMNTGKEYTASTLAKELGLTSYFVTGKVHNIIKSRRKYTVIISDTKPRRIRVIAVRGYFNRNNPTTKLLDKVWK